MLNTSHNKNDVRNNFYIIQKFFYISSNNFCNFLKNKLFNRILKLLKKLFYFKEYIYQIFWSLSYTFRNYILTSYNQFQIFK